jgi:hypothetical protein
MLDYVGANEVPILTASERSKCETVCYRIVPTYIKASICKELDQCPVSL